MASKQVLFRLASLASQTPRKKCAAVVYRTLQVCRSFHGHVRVAQPSLYPLARLHTSPGRWAERAAEADVLDHGREEGFIPSTKKPITREEVEEKTLEVVKAFDKVDADKVNMECHFIKDLGLDSLDAIELVMAVEDEFDVDIPEEDAQQMLTPRSAVEFICKIKKL